MFAASQRIDQASASEMLATEGSGCRAPENVARGGFSGGGRLCFVLCPAGLQSNIAMPIMDFDRLVEQFFGTAEIDTLNSEQLLAGTERLRLQFGLEKDGGRRFALWSLMYMLGIAPDLESAFDDEEDREVAREFMDMADKEIESD